MKTFIKYLYMAILMCLITNTSIAQSISPEPGNYTVCPGQLVVYTVNPNPGFSGCGRFTWTISNGTFVAGQNVTTKVVGAGNFNIDVFWNDVASTGTLTVTSSCAEGVMSKSSTYAIKSLAGRVPANIKKRSV
jgi:hypothetical protein